MTTAKAKAAGHTPKNQKASFGDGEEGHSRAGVPVYYKLYVLLAQKIRDGEFERRILDRIKDVGDRLGCRIRADHRYIDLPGAFAMGVVRDRVGKPGSAIKVRRRREDDVGAAWLPGRARRSRAGSSATRWR